MRPIKSSSVILLVDTSPKTEELEIKIRKAIGRKPKVTYTTMVRLEDALQHNSTITEACNWVGISRTTFFYYMRNNEVFREKMLATKKRQNKVVFSFFTLP